MGIDPSQLRPLPTPLKGFLGDTVQPVGAITLPVFAGTRPCTATTTIDFLGVKAHSLYNAIIRRPTLKNLKVVTSTDHLKMKILAEAGVREVHNKQVLVQECYI